VVVRVKQDPDAAPSRRRLFAILGL
jgi:hypothetical protein